MPQDLSSPPPDIRPLKWLILRTRWLLRSTWVLTGIGLTVGLLLGTLVAVSLADTLVPVHPEITLPLGYQVPGWALRLAALIVVVVPTLWVFLVGVFRPLLRRLAAVQVARRIESHIPGIHNRLVSSLDLASKPEQAQRSPAFYRRLVQEALERVRGFRPAAVVDFPSLRRAAVFTVAGVAGLLISWFFFSDRLATAMARIFDPFADIPPRSGVHYVVTPGNGKVLRGEDINFSVHVDEGTPEQLWLELRSPKTGAQLHYDLDRQKDDAAVWKFTLSSTNIAPGFEDAFQYRVFGGGTWSPQYQVAMLDRPRIVDYHTVLHFPPYMKAEPRLGSPQTLAVTGPEGSQVEVVVLAEGQVSAGDVQLLEYRAPRPGEVAEQQERIWFLDKLPAGAKQDGTWNWDKDRFQKPTHTEPAALGEHGHWFQEATEPFPVGPNESLFTYVYLVPGQEPAEIMLEWHDGSNWDHRAFWGRDVVQLGKANTQGRHRMGPLPEAGKWVRLEVPAEVVGLEGKGVRGMGFGLYGGQCYWYRAGALPAVLGVKDTQPMAATPDGWWAGKFPLQGTGLYRVELRNEAGYPNKTMEEARYVAMPDRPPVVVVDRPGTDLVLSEPGKVPLVVTAGDDFGLAAVRLVMQMGPDGRSARQVLRQYDKPREHDSIVSAIDLAALKLKLGDYVQYSVEAEDCKGQVTRTREYTIRLASDPSAADQQLANFEKGQDPSNERLARLLADQAKVRDKLEKLAAKYAETVEKVEAAQAEVKPAPEGTVKTPDPAKPEANTPTPADLKLDPATAKELEALKKELAELAKQQQQNTQLGQQVGNDLKASAEQMANLKMLPQQMSAQMQALQQLFQNTALPQLQNLNNRMNQGADPKQGDPDVKGLQKLSNQLQKQLEGLQERLRAMNEARRRLREDAEAAIRKLEEDMLRQDAGMTARELEELRDTIAKMREQLKGMEGKQEQVNQETKNAADKDLPEVEKKQEGLDKALNDLLAEARRLLENDKARRMKRKPSFPNEPYNPENGEELVRPKEEDPDEPAANKDKKEAGDKSGDKAENKDQQEEKEDLYMPALGGPKPKVDPRYKGKERPLAKKPKNGDKGEQQEDPAERREGLEEHQEQNLRNADRAEKSLASDQQTLEDMLRQLQQAMKPGNGQKGQPGDEQADSQKLAQLLQSKAMQQALAMCQRCQGGQQGKPGQKSGQAQGQSTTGNQNGTPRSGAAQEAELAKLDPATRTVIMRMPPRQREELLQGMREEGPEGYQKFIQDYFRRLTEVKGPQ